MWKQNKYSTHPEVFAIFEKALPRPSMFLIDSVLTKDLKVVYRSRSGEIEYAFIKSYQKNQWAPDVKFFIKGDDWGSLSGKLFDDLSALAEALRKRGLEQVEL
ncbi:hypothetical protein ACN1C3_03170 [Pseudomonas sp. H11T01]|uniref:hypothetical protein n=1 Tax=Pseudomonas sp. H11T01 TaxID=3402749 RepID=UPI003AC22F42